MAILAVNAGSSSLKFALYPRQADGVGVSLLTGLAEGLEPGGQAQMRWSRPGQASGTATLAAAPGASAMDAALSALRALLAREFSDLTLVAVAHRVVHGGATYRASVCVDAAVLAQLVEFIPLAPLHQPANLAGLRAFGNAFVGVPQVACFDTAFHASLPQVDYQFALPQALAEQGLRRYGFHGLSYQYVIGALQAASPRAQGRVLMAHLGNGASLCAAQQGHSVATTMGFSALDGLMMGTRTGSLDAGVLLYLLEHGWTHDRLQKLLYKESGLLGVSGLSADMRRLRLAYATDPHARMAVDMFVYRVVRESGALAACLGGLDVLAFSGGIGEHDVALREQVGARLAWMGVHIDPARNAQAGGDALSRISTPDSAVEVWVVPTDEGVVAAREAARLLRQAA